MQDFHSKLMGISFSTPATLLDTSQPLTVGGPSDGSGSASAETPFLWQAPTSDAVMFMGEKWVELHGYVSQILEKQAQMSATPALISKKEISKKHPAWLESVLQLSRIRGYLTLYPGQETANTILGVHTELNDKPEEYEDDPEDPTAGLRDQANEPFNAGSQVDMLTTLPKGGVLSTLADLPVLSWDGAKVQLSEIDATAIDYAAQFRREVGECRDVGVIKADRHARDLFCKSKAAET